MKINNAFIAALAALAPSAEAAVTIDANSSLRKIDGFGFSQAFGRAKEFQTAPSGMQKQALDYLFSTTTGAGFSIIRNRIGSGGSGDSIEPNNPGSPSANPSYTWDNDDRGQVWFTKQAVAYGVKTIYADAWSAPGFMKTSGNEATPGYLCGSTGHSCSSGDWRQAYANFLVQYVKYYAQIGIKVTHLGFLNEPDYKVSYSQMQISNNAQEAISFIPTLSKAVQAAGLDTVIACCDPVGWPMAKTYTPNLVNAGMEQYLGVMTSHTYSGDANSKLDTKLPVWVTEAGTGDASRFVTTWYSNGAAGDGLTWANKIATGMIDAGLSAYLYWEGFENKQTQSGSHLVDTFDGSTATPNGIFWAFAMWSRHIRPGASALSVSGSISGVKTGAFKNTDGTIVIVYTNSGASQQTGSAYFSGFTPGTASAWLTDNSHTFASTSATISGSSVNVNLPARSVVTVKLSSGGSSQPPSSTLTTSTSSTASVTRTSTASSAGPTADCAKLYEQCGGKDYSGPTCCVSSTCKFSNDWYSQCL